MATVEDFVVTAKAHKAIYQCQTRCLPLVQPRFAATLEQLVLPYCLKNDAKCVSRHPAPGTTYAHPKVSCNALTAA